MKLNLKIGAGDWTGVMMKLYEQAPHLKKVVEQTGYVDLRSLLFLHNLVKQVQPEVVVELGTGFGCSAIFMALGWEETTIVTVDDYRGDTSTHLWTSKGNVEDCGVGDQVILLDGDSRDKMEMGIPAEMVFMDASHNPKDMIDELSALEGNLKQNHILVIDDIYSVHLDKFSFDLLKKGIYQELHVFPFHNGVAVLSTAPGVYRQKITDAAHGVYDV